MAARKKFDWIAESRAIARNPDHPQHANLLAVSLEVAKVIPAAAEWCRAWSDADREADEWCRMIDTLPAPDVGSLSPLAAIALAARRTDDAPLADAHRRSQAGARLGGAKGGRSKTFSGDQIAAAVRDYRLNGADLPLKTIAARHGMGRTRLTEALKEAGLK